VGLYYYLTVLKVVYLYRSEETESLPLPIRERAARVATSPAALPASGFDLEAHVKGIERDYIAQALERAGGVQTKAAELLGMSFRSFRYYVKKYNLR
jgi:two-component system response regulator PilR (NtrC family)